MNKLQGFYALAKSNLPAVPWMKYEKDTNFNPDILWTIRSAVTEGEDLNLPRKIGVNGNEAKVFAQELNNNLKPEDMIIYYPYFIAVKSGVIDISRHRIAIEAVKADLWNLVTNNEKDVTIIFEDEDVNIIGDEYFLTQEEMIELVDYCSVIKRQFQREIANGKNILLEWSYACKSDINKQPIGEAGLVFYEIRTV
ncbi:MAG: hypothetical protein WCD89_04585 [Anaerocolumna sp.]